MRVWNVIDRNTGLLAHRTSEYASAVKWAMEHDPYGQYDGPHPQLNAYNIRSMEIHHA